MKRQPLIQLVQKYPEESAHDRQAKQQLLQFIEENADCFERELQIGHITGSAWILNKKGTHALMAHHTKLDIWVQLGGHADGDTDIIGVATKEALEESGLESVHLRSQDIFDIDIHEIPPYKNDPAHLHYDVRFLFEADREAPLVQNRESKELKWIPLKEVESYTSQESVLRLVRKSESL